MPVTWPYSANLMPVMVLPASQVRVRVSKSFAVPQMSLLAPEQVLPSPQAPHDPPQPSSPHCLPLHSGTQAAFLHATAAVMPPRVEMAVAPLRSLANSMTLSVSGPQPTTVPSSRTARTAFARVARAMMWSTLALVVDTTGPSPWPLRNLAPPHATALPSGVIYTM